MMGIPENTGRHLADGGNFKVTQTKQLHAQFTIAMEGLKDFFSLLWAYVRPRPQREIDACTYASSILTPDGIALTVTLRGASVSFKSPAGEAIFSAQHVPEVIGALSDIERIR